MCLASFSFIVLFKAMTPPNALIGSAACAFKNALLIFLCEEIILFTGSGSEYLLTLGYGL